MRVSNQLREKPHVDDHQWTLRSGLGDGALYYEVAGAGETVVLSHAAFLDSRMFDEQWDVLAQRYRVIRYDMRGYGQSSAV
ncbi:MAG: serine hydrolase, partial [Anaerolineae bacterium]|nr:serine hydrolase [Anaerolineae bacterium]